LSPPCGGGAPRSDLNQNGWGGVRINAILEIPYKQTTPALTCPAPPSKGGDKVYFFN